MHADFHPGFQQFPELITHGVHDTHRVKRGVKLRVGAFEGSRDGQLATASFVHLVLAFSHGEHLFLVGEIECLRETTCLIARILASHTRSDVCVIHCACVARSGNIVVGITCKCVIVQVGVKNDIFCHSYYGFKLNIIITSGEPAMVPLSNRKVTHYLGHTSTSRQKNAVICCKT